MPNRISACGKGDLAGVGMQIKEIVLLDLVGEIGEIARDVMNPKACD